MGLFNDLLGGLSGGGLPGLSGGGSSGATGGFFGSGGTSANTTNNTNNYQEQFQGPANIGSGTLTINQTDQGAVQAAVDAIKAALSAVMGSVKSSNGVAIDIGSKALDFGSDALNANVTVTKYGLDNAAEAYRSSLGFAGDALASQGDLAQGALDFARNLVNQNLEGVNALASQVSQSSQQVVSQGVQRVALYAFAAVAIIFIAQSMAKRA